MSSSTTDVPSDLPPLECGRCERDAAECQCTPTASMPSIVYGDNDSVFVALGNAEEASGDKHLAEYRAKLLTKKPETCRAYVVYTGKTTLGKMGADPMRDDYCLATDLDGDKSGKSQENASGGDMNAVQPCPKDIPVYEPTPLHLRRRLGRFNNYSRVVYFVTDERRSATDDNAPSLTNDTQETPIARETK